MAIRILTRAALAAAALGSCAGSRSPEPAPAPECIVGRVVDGDTFYCRDGRKVRLIGIDSPERGQGAAAQLAARALARLAPVGRAVRLEGDVAPADRYGRSLAWVWAGGTLVNEAMVRGGWALLYTVPPNVKYVGRLEQAQKEARGRGAGLWGSGGFDCPPRAYRRRECAAPP
ncbi:MAG: thermonuclease family protein [Gemmatimonadales bacterium]